MFSCVWREALYICFSVLSLFRIALQMGNRGAPIAPLGTYNEAGEVVWDSTLVARIKELGAEPQKK